MRRIAAPGVIAGVGFVLAIVLAELVTSLVNPLIGVVSHIVILAALLVHGTVSRDHLASGFSLALAIAPMVRIVTLGLPLGAFPQTWWYALASVPLLAACFVTIRALGLRARQVGLQLPVERRGWLVTALVATSGIAIGYVEFMIMRPVPLISTLSPGALILPSVILIVSTGFTEELIFRGVIQATAVRIFGVPAGIVVVSVVFAALHIGHLSALNVGFVMLVSLYFGVVVWKTRTLVGVTLAHGLTNVGLLLIFPNL